MIDAPSRKDRLEFQKLCAECQRLESELRQSAFDPVTLERTWLAVWHKASLTKGWDERVKHVIAHHEALAREVRNMSEARWQIISKVNN